MKSILAILFMIINSMLIYAIKSKKKISTKIKEGKSEMRETTYEELAEANVSKSKKAACCSNYCFV